LAASGRKRTRYSAWQKQQVTAHYAGLRSFEDRLRFCAHIGILDEKGEPSVDRLYNIACRLGVSGKRDFSRIVADETRRMRRDDPDTIIFSKSGDRYLRQEWGRTPIEAIADHLDLTETAIFYHARQLGLRKPSWYWDARKVAAWLGLSLPELRALHSQGVSMQGLLNRHGWPAIELVSTSSLGRWLREPRAVKKLSRRDPDQFFLLEVAESLDALVEGGESMPKCRFLLQGDICGQPRTVSFGHYCTKTERNEAGDDKKCNARRAEITDLTLTDEALYARDRRTRR
jgi:hypothetical protein